MSASGGFRYSVCGLLVEANQAIPALTPHDAEAHPVSLRITFGPDPTWPDIAKPDSSLPFYASTIVNDDDVPLLRAWTYQRGAFIRLMHDTGADCLVDRSGAHIWMAWPSTAIDPHVFLLEHVIAFVLRLQGVTCLHAAVVVVGRHATALAGPPGVGKSMLAAALARCGHRVLTDDVAAVDRTDAGFVVHPGPRFVRPRREASPQLRDVLPHPGEWRYSPDGAYVDLVPDRSDYVQALAPAPLAAVWFLVPRPGQPLVRTEAVRPADAVMRLIGDAWARRLADRAMRAQEIDQVSEIVGMTPAWQLLFDPATQWLIDACREIEHLAGAATHDRRAS